MLTVKSLIYKTHLSAAAIVDIAIEIFISAFHITKADKNLFHLHRLTRLDVERGNIIVSSQNIVGNILPTPNFKVRLVKRLGGCN